MCSVNSLWFCVMLCDNYMKLISIYLTLTYNKLGWAGPSSARFTQMKICGIRFFNKLFWGNILLSNFCYILIWLGVNLIQLNGLNRFCFYTWSGNPNTTPEFAKHWRIPKIPNCQNPSSAQFLFVHCSFMVGCTASIWYVD